MNLIKENNHKEALVIWNKLAGFIPWLFKATNPGPIKYLLKKSGLIISDELRLPLTGPSEEYKKTLNNLNIE